MVEPIPRLAAALSVALLAAACAPTRHESVLPPPTAPVAPTAVAPPREPRAELTGTASWYGRPHHGRPTASGEPFDMNAFTAAHRTLPLGTRVRVTNLGNGRAIQVRINDRGPTRSDRIIDLSYGAARALGAVGEGVFPVRISVLE